MINSSGNFEDTDQCCFWGEEKTSCLVKGSDGTPHWVNISADNEVPSACSDYMKDPDSKCIGTSVIADCNTAKKAECCFTNSYYNSCYGYDGDAIAWIPNTDYGADPGCAEWTAKGGQCHDLSADCDKGPDGLRCCFKDNTLTSCWGYDDNNDPQSYPVIKDKVVNDKCGIYLDRGSCDGTVQFCTQAKAPAPPKPHPNPTPPKPHPNPTPPKPHPNPPGPKPAPNPTPPKPAPNPTPPKPAPNPPGPNPPTGDSSSHKTLIIVLIILGVVLLAMSGVFLYYHFYKNNKPQGGLNNIRIL